ncbi:GGDEF domain-containing protein [Desulfovibrio ferrophilus]|uniref:diguanylate cyclase n=1 Tax=Desulfovibrio ferrophilus TaxID=241368 RepID=A0A2Z6AWI2_9BACT|nr:GGDEF domain-containing protein [Desulfovibrio ferrophilus]BBD07588.1 diguanylate cyclase [Desulfovibrio ferrophilus]
MNMPKNTAEDILSAKEKEILSELESLRKLLQVHGADATCVESTQKVLGILRLCPGLSMDQWPALSEEYGLRDWLALPVDGEEYPFLSQIQNSLQELAYQTEHDPLTTLANRRAFDRLLDQEIERAKRMGDSLSIAILDLDNFKAVNDTHGHPCGDDVLVGLSKLLLTKIRRYDVAARLGGEEFALLLPGTGLLKSRAMLERILESVRELTFNCSADGTPFSVTCSAGLVCYKGVSDSPIPDLVDLADKALYKAKAQGKDRVITAPLADMQKLSKASLVESNEKKFLFTGNG